MANLSSAVSQRIAAIHQDNTHGASWLAREALRVVGACAGESADGSAAVLLERVRSCVGALIDARPEMAPIRFWIERLRQEIDDAATPDADTTRLREAVLQSVGRLVAQSEQAGQRAIENAVARLPAGSVVFTASFSQTVVNACRLASERGKLRALLVAESVDAEGRRHGRLLAAAIGEVSAAVEVIPDDLAPSRVVEADRVWLGADSVLPDGSVLNGTPSLAIAEAAVAAGRPVEIIAEAAKIERGSGRYEEERRRAESVNVPTGMDRLPGELIAVVVTENGVVEGRASPPHPLSSRTGEGNADLGGARELSPSPVELERGRGGEVLPGPSAQDDGDAADAAGLIARVAERLVARHETVAVIETATGGRICDLLTDRPGSSAWFAGGVVAYSAASVRGLAGVSAEVTQTFGAVSAQTAQALADSARLRFDAAWGIGETGIAGPQIGRRSSKPVGLAYVAVSGPDERRRVVEVSTGRDDRVGNKHAFAVAALGLLADEL